MPLDIGVFYSRLIIIDKDANNFGLLPLMAGCCDGQIGALNAESYSERINSAAKIIMTNQNTRLNDEDLERLTVLRMNRDFIVFMRDNYFYEIKAQQPFNMTLI